MPSTTTNPKQTMAAAYVQGGRVSKRIKGGAKAGKKGGAEPSTQAALLKRIADLEAERASRRAKRDGLKKDIEALKKAVAALPTMAYVNALIKESVEKAMKDTVTKEELNATMARMGEQIDARIKHVMKGYVTKEELEDRLKDCVTKEEVDRMIADATAGFVTEARVREMIAEAMEEWRGQLDERVVTSLVFQCTRPG